MNEAELKSRTKRFALRVLKLLNALPNNPAGRALANQLARCGPSVGVNYRSACRARSTAEFLSRLAIAEDEADESAYWLEIIIEAGMLKEPQVRPLQVEAVELVKILTSSRLTAGGGGRRPKSKIENQKSKITP